MLRTDHLLYVVSQGFGFLTVDEIARANRCRLNDPMRIEGCINYCMDRIMKEGHLFQEKEQFTDMVYRQLNEGFSSEVVQEQEVSTAIYHMTQDGDLVVEQGAIYPVSNYRNEKRRRKSLRRYYLRKNRKRWRAKHWTD